LKVSCAEPLPLVEAIGWARHVPPKHPAVLKVTDCAVAWLAQSKEKAAKPMQRVSDFTSLIN
jgi:hypothetical protein